MNRSMDLWIRRFVDYYHLVFTHEPRKHSGHAPRITPLLHYSITPLFHHSTTQLLHYPIFPLLRHSIFAVLHHA